MEENIEKIEKRILKLKEEQKTIKAEKEKAIEIKNETKQEIEKLTAMNVVELEVVAKNIYVEPKEEEN